MTAVKLCGIMANDNERTADGADNGNGNNDSTQKVDEMLPNEMNQDDIFPSSRAMMRPRHFLQ